MKTAYQLYMREIENIPPLSKDAEMKHFIAWKEHGINSSRNKIYRSNLRLVVKVAHKYKNQGVDILDLINEGNLGLYTAMRRFDHNRNLKFISYAIWYIRQAMLELLARQSRFVSITGAEAVFKVNLNKAKNSLMQKLDREPTEYELSKETGFSVEKIRHMENTLENTSAISTDSFLKKNNAPNNKITVVNNIKDDKFGSPETSNDLTGAILTAFDQASLNEQEKNILSSYFGINRQKRNLEEISFDYEMSRERMRQIKEKALKTLKAFTKNSKKLNIPNALEDVF